MNARRLCTCALMTALLCVMAPLTLPVGAVPVSLATFAVYLAAQVSGPGDACRSTAAYILLGLAGLPVFSGFSGGAGVLIGPTGGYLIGYIPCALLSGLCRDSRRRNLLWTCAGTAMLYAVGTAWYCIAADVHPFAALGTCVAPFLPGDACKIAAAVWIGGILRRRLTDRQR